MLSAVKLVLSFIFSWRKFKIGKFNYALNIQTRERWGKPRIVPVELGSKIG